MNRLKVVLFWTVLCLCAVAASAQIVSINFEQFADRQTSETLNIPGVTFAPSPAGSWEVVDVLNGSLFGNLGFASLSGKALFEPFTDGQLDITFSTSVAGVSFSFADSDTTGVGTVKAEAFSGAGSVGSVTLTGSPAGQQGYGEGFIKLSPGPTFNRVRISSPTGNAIAIDNLAATGASVVIISQPAGMLQASGSGGATDSYVIANNGSIQSSVTLTQAGSFFTQSPTSFTLAPGAQQVVSITGTAQGSGAFDGRSNISGAGVPSGLGVPVKLLSESPPTGTVIPVPSANRVDVSSAQAINPSGFVTFKNNGASTLQGIAVSNVPWIKPQTGLITIAPGASVNVSFTIDRALRPDSSFPLGSVSGSISLVYLTNGAGKFDFDAPLGTPPSGLSLVTIVDTSKPAVSANGVPALTAGEVALYVPGVGHVLGSVGTFVSDVTLGNAVDLFSLGNVLLRYTPTTGSAADANLTTVPGLLPNQALSLADVVKNVYGADAQVGSLQIRSSAISSVAVSANIFVSDKPLGTFGTAIPIFRSDRAAGTGSQLYLPGLLRDGTHHTNLFVQETEGFQTNVHIDFLNAGGAVLGSLDPSVDAFKLLQINNPLPNGAVAAIVRNSGGTGKILSYATPVDELSFDTWAVADWNAQFGSPSNQAVLIPVAGSVAGANNTFFRTDVAAINNGATAVTLKLEYYPANGPVVTKTTSLSIKQSFVSTDIVKNFFLLNTDSVGYIIVTPQGGSAATTSRTYTTVAGSTQTFGTAVPALPLSASLPLGGKKVIAGLEDASLATISRRTGATFRTNVGLIETAGGTATVRITLLFADGRSLASGAVATKDFSLTPRQFLPINGIAKAILGDTNRALYGDIRNLQLKFEVVSGDGAVALYTSSTDNGTGDSILRTE
ncbi:MAG TPA: hypothetical protein VHL58_18505 [Thermoanaerobaculia bacterium]|nr:hypothetical protein [Thermoanaerobaculia bacterium]